MRWESKSLLKVYTYLIDVEALLIPVYHLVIDVVSANYAGRSFKDWAVEVFDVKTIIGKDAIGEEMTTDMFLIEIASYLKGHLYANVDKLQGSDIQLMYAPKSILVAPVKSNPTKILIGWIKKAGVMKGFLDLVKYEPISKSKATLETLLNDQYFGTAVTTSENCLLRSTSVPMGVLEGYEVQPVDAASIWINKAWYSDLGVKESTDFGEVKFADIDGVSLKVGDNLVPLTGIDQHIKEAARQDYFWAMLCNIYACKKKSVSYYRGRCTDFKAALKESEFALLMTKLHYNLYIKKDGHAIPEAVSQYFEEVYNIEEFIDKNSQILFTGTHLEEQLQNKQTMLGIYNTEKDGTDYNLHAWLNVENAEKQVKSEASSVEEVNIKTVYALKPQYSYYFSSTYFEDLFQDVLGELGITSLHDVELSVGENPNSPYIEVDNFVRKQDGTIVFIENKTTLNRYNIEETIGKIARFHQVMAESYPTVRMEYLIAAPYKNDTVEEAYSYFTNMEGCSSSDFYLPIARFNGIRLHCVIEPEYEKIKAKMATLLK